MADQAEDRSGLNVESVEVLPTKRDLFQELAVASRETHPGEIRSLTTAVSVWLRLSIRCSSSTCSGQQARSCGQAFARSAHPTRPSSSRTSPATHDRLGVRSAERSRHPTRHSRREPQRHTSWPFASNTRTNSPKTHRPARDRATSGARRPRRHPSRHRRLSRQRRHANPDRHGQHRRHRQRLSRGRQHQHRMGRISGRVPRVRVTRRAHTSMSAARASPKDIRQLKAGTAYARICSLSAAKRSQPSTARRDTWHPRSQPAPPTSTARARVTSSTEPRLRCGDQPRTTVRLRQVGDAAQGADGFPISLYRSDLPRHRSPVEPRCDCGSS